MGEVPQQDELIELEAGPGDAGTRVDVFIAARLEVTRSQLGRAFDAGLVSHNGDPARKGVRLEAGDRLTVVLPARPVVDLEPRPVDFRVIHEEDGFLVIDKPPDLSVHPAAGQRMDTLVHGLLHRYPELSDSGGDHRPGIVHRLDRFTSGVILVAKTNRMHEGFARQFEARTVNKRYEAITSGVLEFDQNLVDAPIARDRKFRERMAVDRDGKEAVTRIDVVDRYERVTHVRCHPQQGRRHQIRVHCQHLGHRLLCDTTYGGANRVTVSTLAGRPPKDGEPVLLGRLALHAARLELDHPETGDRIAFEADLPEDMAGLIRHLNDARMGA